MRGARRAIVKTVRDEGVWSWGSQAAQWLFIVFAVIAVCVLAAVLGAYVAINVSRLDRYITRIHRLNDAAQPVGFSAYKNGTQAVATATTVVVNDWAIVNGLPAYNYASTAFNMSSGIFTCAHAGQYIVAGLVCYTGTADGGGRAASINTDGAGATSSINTVEIAGSNATTTQCIQLSQVLDLAVGTAVWLETLQDSGGPETLTAESRFSVERIASFLP